MHGQDYAINLSGALDVMKPAILLMIKSQALTLPPWKIVAWSPHVLHVLEDVEMELEQLRTERVQIPDGNLPKLNNHWKNLTKENVEECTFHDMEVLDGWMVIDQETAVVSPVRGQRRKETVYNWVARFQDDCLRDLVVLCQEMKSGLQKRYDNVVLQNVTNVAEMFDLESLVDRLCSFRFEDGKLKIQSMKRRIWELHGDAEFHDFFRSVCYCHMSLNWSKNLQIWISYNIAASSPTGN